MNFLKGTGQYNLIKVDLARVDKEDTFIVIHGHHSMYTTSNEVREALTRKRLLESLEPLLVYYNVTLAL